MSVALELQGVEVRFGGLRAVAGLDLHVRTGTIHALIGPNGAGKSTALNSISRFVTPVRGDILFEGRSILRFGPHRMAGLGIARAFQNLELCGRLSVLENVLVGLAAVPSRGRGADRAAAMELLDRIGLADEARVPAERLPFGRQKQLDLARALASRPRLLLLDEPAAGLRNRDIRALDAMLLDLCRRDGVTILLVEHVMSLVMSVADRITVLNHGEKISEGSAAEIRTDPRVIAAYLGRAADVAA
ncbi:MAG TPA: ABC transporter ATP-binding protein [Acetobacteraceae bacterium]|nr:ABC transporter ATP-binding protein [Acetobacteraceae bacterium]